MMSFDVVVEVAKDDLNLALVNDSPRFSLQDRCRCRWRKGVAVIERERVRLLFW